MFKYIQTYTQNSTIKIQQLSFYIVQLFKQGTILMSHLYIPPCLHLDFVNNSGTIRNGFFQKTADSGYYSNRGRQIEDIMYIIDKLELTQLYLGTYVHYIKTDFSLVLERFYFYK